MSNTASPQVDLAGFSVAESLRSAQLQRLEELSAERVRRHEESLNLYEPMPEQDAFHQSRAWERLLRGGNRGGKSLAAFVEDARCVLGIDPYRKYPTHRPLQLWIIGFDEGHLGRVVYRLLFEPGAFRVIRDLHTGLLRAYRPWQEEDRQRSKESRPAAPLIPARFAPPESFAWKDKARRIFTVARLQFPPDHPMQGTEIHCFPSGGEAPQGSAVDLIHIDEDLKYARHVAEYQARLSDNEGGRLIWSAMPHMKNAALVQMSARAEEQEGEESPDVQEFRLTFSGNRYVDAEQKALRLAGWSEEERRLRDQGDFIFDVTAMYPEFDVSLHGVPSKLNEDHVERNLVAGQVPDHWTRYMVVDPGHSFCAVLFAAVPPPRLGNYVLAYDELYIRNCTAARFADAVARKAEGQSFRAFIIDDHGSRVREAGSGRRIREQYSQELRQRKIRSEITAYGFLKGSDDVLGRTSEVRRWLSLRNDGTTKFRILQQKCPHTLREFRYYKKRVSADESQDKPISANDHLMNCFDGITEVLSTEGWRRFSELPDAAQVATVNLASDEIEYQFPTARVVKHYVGEMVRFGGHKLNGLVTPDHRMVVYSSYARNHGGDPAIRRAADLRPSDGVKLHAKWKGTPREVVLVPKIPNALGLEKEIAPENFAEFLGWYIAEGCCDVVPKCPGNGYRVFIAQKHQQKRVILSALLSQLPWKWTSTPNGFSCSSKQLWSYLVPLGNCYGKRVPSWIKNSTPEVIRRFLVGAVLGDGNIQKGRRNYATVSPFLADDVQELFIKLGLSASVRTREQQGYCIDGRQGDCSLLYLVSEWTVPTGHLRNSKGSPNYSSVEYDGPVYCVTVPNGTLIVRRDGKPMIAGNCIEYLAAHNPRYFSPRHRKPEESAVYKEFQSWQESPNRLTGLNRFVQGSGSIYLGPGVPV